VRVAEREREVPLLGPSLAALNPITALFATVSPYDAMNSTLTDSQAGEGLARARVALAVGAILGIGVYGGVVYGIHASMVRGFDFTVRKLAGRSRPPRSGQAVRLRTSTVWSSFGAPAWSVITLLTRSAMTSAGWSASPRRAHSAAPPPYCTPAASVASIMPSETTT
jgi:hypothetical protein